MADTYTTNLNLVQPEVGGSDDSWGTKINNDLASIDSLFDTGPVLKVAKGGTGAATAAGARTALGLGDAATGDIGTDVQAYDATLTSLAALGTAADKLAYTTAVDTWAETAITSFGRSLIDDADAAAARTTLGLGNAATGTIGTDVQAYDALLADIAGMTLTSGDILYADGAASLAQLPKGTAGQVLTMNTGATAPEWADVSGGATEHSSSPWTATGSSITFGSIPAGTSRIRIAFAALSLTTNVSPLVKLGDSGGIESVGYQGIDAYHGGQKAITSSGFNIVLNGSSRNANGIMEIVRTSENTWVMNSINAVIGDVIWFCAGSKTLSAELTQIQISISSGSFDSGTISVFYQ